MRVTGCASRRVWWTRSRGADLVDAARSGTGRPLRHPGHRSPPQVAERAAATGPGHRAASRSHERTSPPSKRSSPTCRVAHSWRATRCADRRRQRRNSNEADRARSAVRRGTRGPFRRAHAGGGTASRRPRGGTQTPDAAARARARDRSGLRSAYVARAIWGDGDAATAEADFRRGLELDPSNGRGLVAFSEFLDRQGRYDEGDRVLDRALLVDPLSPRLHFRLVMRDFDRQGEPFPESGTEARPRDRPGLPARAAALLASDAGCCTGRWRRPPRSWSTRSKWIPDNPWSRHTATAMYLDLGDEAAAREVADGTQAAGESGQLAAGPVPRGLAYRRRGRATRQPGRSTTSPRAGARQRPCATTHSRPAITGGRSLSSRSATSSEATDPRLDITNFRAAAYLAQLLRASGDRCARKAVARSAARRNRRIDSTLRRRVRAPDQGIGAAAVRRSTPRPCARSRSRSRPTT